MLWSMTPSSTPPAPRPRDAVAALPTYQPGKAAEVAMREHALESAIKLASNENPYEPLPSVVAAVAGAAASSANRYPDHRATAVREALAERHGLAVEQVAVGCGSVGLLQQLLLTYADPGDEVLYGWRSFEAYPIYSAMVGARTVTVPNRFETIDVDGLRRALSARTRVVFVTSPNNPTGTVVADDGLEALLAEASPDTLVVLDEAYHEYVTGQHAPRALDLLHRHANLAVLRTFSKAYGLAALRIGYLFAHPDVVSAVDRTLVPFAVSGLAQAAALASLDADEELGERVNRTILERERVAAALRSLGFGLPDPQANFVWLPAGDAAAALAMKLETLGVVTRPFPGEGVRVTCGTSEENDRFLAAFDACIEPLELAVHWQLPTGETARHVQALIERVDRLQERLVELAADGHAGLTSPDPTTGERWDAGQVWGHLAELGPFWLGQVHRIVNAASEAPVAFGRPPGDTSRAGGIEAGRHHDVGELLVATQRSLDATRAAIAGFADVDLARRGVNPAVGEVDVLGLVDRLIVGHVEEHVDQLEGLSTT